MDNITKLAEKINDADAIVIGAGSGMSNAAGMDFWYENSPVILEDPDLRYLYEKYHFQGLFNAFYTPFESQEERWTFLTKLYKLLTTIQPKNPTYEYLQKILTNKTFHIVTTNQDMMFLRYFDQKQVSEIQGSWTYFQAKNIDRDKNLYPTKPMMEDLLTKIDDHLIPSEFIPTSDIDNQELIPWVRGPEFLEDKQYFEEHEKLNKFIGKYKDSKLLFIEMGVGRMTPMFIQEPFWEMTQYLKNASYVNINPKDALCNPAIKDKALLINDDINEVLKETSEKIEEAKNV